MIRLGPSARVYAFGSAVDMRKGFEGLLALATQTSQTPLCGDLFLFVGRTRKRAKVLYFDGTGLCLFHKRLETGRFACLWQTPQKASLSLSLTELQLFLEGCSLVGTQRLSPSPLTAAALRPARPVSARNNRT